MKGRAGLMKHLFSDNRMISDLRRMLEEEFLKSDDERDYNTICELTSAIVDISDTEVPQPDTEAILRKAAEGRRRNFTRTKKTATGLTANLFSDKLMISDLRQMLDEETRKSENEKDYDTINEITEAIIDISNVEIPQPDVNAILKKAASGSSITSSDTVHLFSDSSMISDLRQMLDEEISKPENEKNYNTISELTEAIVELSGDNIPQPDMNAIIKKAAVCNSLASAEKIHLFSDSSMLSDLRQMFDDEIQKPENEIDYNAISELTAAIVEISGVRIPKPDTDAILQRAAESRRRSFADVKKSASSLMTHLISDNQMISDMKKMLDEEFLKSDEEIDYNTICELTSAIMDVSDDEIPQPDTSAILKKASTSKRRDFTFIKKFAAGISACFIAGLAANCYTLLTHGENLWDTILRKSKGGYTIDLGAQPGVDPQEYSLPGDDTDPAQSSEYVVNCMLDLCGEHGVEPFVPSELPPEIAYDGVFEMTESHYEHMADSNDFYFTFENGNTQMFTISLEKYDSAEVMPEVLIPSDSNDVRDEDVNGTHIYVFPLNNRATAVFVHDDICYTINGYNISTDAIFKLASGFVPASLMNGR